MSWWWPFGGSSSGKATAGSSATQEEREKLARKCRAYINGLESCRRANIGPDQALICRNLEMRVVTCYACEHCVPQSDEHRRCYMKVYTTGSYNGKANCIQYENAMTDCLKKRGLFPV